MSYFPIQQSNILHRMTINKQLLQGKVRQMTKRRAPWRKSPRMSSLSARWIAFPVAVSLQGMFCITQKNFYKHKKQKHLKLQYNSLQKQLSQYKIIKVSFISWFTACPYTKCIDTRDKICYKTNIYIYVVAQTEKALCPQDKCKCTNPGTKHS